MYRVASLVVACWLAQVPGNAESAPAQENHRELMTYVDEQGRSHPVRTVEDWAIRRRHILAGMQAAMGPLPDRSGLPPVRFDVVHTELGNGFRRLTVRFDVAPGEPLSAYLYFPRSVPDVVVAAVAGGDSAGKRPPDEARAAPRERLPAVLALHPTSPLGKARITTEGGQPNRMYADELAQRGYVVIAPDYPSFGDSKGYDFGADRYVSGTMKGIFNHMRCIDLLERLQVVDPHRVAAVGHSLGGHNAMFVGVFDERIKVVVSSCGWTAFHHYYGGNLAGWTSPRYMPLLREKYALDPDRVPFDFYEVVAALAPRAFFSSSPLHDSNFDVTGVRKVIPEAAKVFRLFGAEERLVVCYPDCEHDFPPEVRRKAYRFIDRVLHHKPACEVP